MPMQSSGAELTHVVTLALQITDGGLRGAKLRLQLLDSSLKPGSVVAGSGLLDRLDRRGEPAQDIGDRLGVGDGVRGRLERVHVVGRLRDLVLDRAQSVSEFV